jgi:hypothetical protein
MKEVMHYISDDGMQFNTREEALKADEINRRVQLADHLPKLMRPVGSRERIHIGTDCFDKTKHNIVMLCRELWPDESVFQHDPKVIHPRSYAIRFIDEMVPKCIKNIWYRLARIEDGYEYDQMYFAINPDKFIGETIEI